MKKQENLEKLEEVMELEAGVLTIDTILANLDEWNSMARLSLIVLMDDDFDKKLSATQLKNFKTVGDILDFMEA